MAKRIRFFRMKGYQGIKKPQQDVVDKLLQPWGRLLTHREWKSEAAEYNEQKLEVIFLSIQRVVQELE